MIIKKFFINSIQEIVDKSGLIIVKKKFIDFDKKFELSKLNLSEANILVNYKLHNLITTAGKKLGSLEDPYYYALKESLPITEKKKFIQSFTNKIKFIVKSPRTAAEAIGLGDSKILSKYPEWALVKPWEEKLIEESYQSYLVKFVLKRKKLKKLYATINKEKRENIIYNDLAWESHAEQFFKLYNSINKNGFKNTNLVSVNLFVHNGVNRLSLSEDGNHRTRIAYALDLNTIPLKVSKIVDLNNVNDWFNVKNQLYTPEEAKKIFVNYFNYSGQGAFV